MSLRILGPPGPLARTTHFSVFALIVTLIYGATRKLSDSQNQLD